MPPPLTLPRPGGRPLQRLPADEGTGVRETSNAANAREARAQRDNGTPSPVPMLDGGSTTTQRVTGTLNIRGNIPRPTMVANGPGLFNQLQTGTLDVAVPMRAGKIPLNSWISARVPPDTTIHARMDIQDGKITNRTRIEFLDSNGDAVEIDGPFIWDLDSFYIEDGKIKAEVDCFPDPNITSKIFPGHDRIPEGAGDFAKLLLDRLGAPDEVPIIPGRTEAPSQTTRTADPENTDSDAPTASRGPARSNGRPTPSAPGSSRSASRSGDTIGDRILNAIDFDGQYVNFEGTLKPGPIQFGDDTTIGFTSEHGAGPRINVSGRLDQLKVEASGRVSRVEMRDGESRVTSGPGRVGVTVDLTTGLTTSGAPSEQPGQARVAINEFNLRNIAVRSPGAEGQQNSIRIGQLEVAASSDEEPYFASTPEGLSVHLPNISMRGLQADLQVEGSNGEDGTFHLGSQGSGPLNVDASLHVDTGEDRFVFDTHVQRAEVVFRSNDGDVLGFVDAPGVSLGAVESTIRGTGRVLVSREPDQDPRLLLQADPKDPFVATVSGLGATVGTGAEDAPLHAQVSARRSDGSLTENEISITTLDLAGNDRPPVVDAKARFEVAVQGLRLRTEDGRVVRIAEGSHGELVVDQLNWEPGKRSPVVGATLNLNLGGEVELTPTEMESLRGAGVTVRAQPGGTTLSLRVDIDETGKVTGNTHIDVDNLSVATDFRQGNLDDIDPPVSATAPKEIVGRDAAGLSRVTPPTPRDFEPTALTGVEHGNLSLPDLSIPTRPVLEALDAANIDVTVPFSRARAEVELGTGYRTSKNFLGAEVEELGYSLKAQVDLQQRGDTPGQMQVHLRTANGEVIPARGGSTSSARPTSGSYISVDPPIRLKLSGAAYIPYAPNIADNFELEISRIDLRQEDGKLKVHPVFEVEGEGFLTLGAVGEFLNDTVGIPIDEAAQDAAGELLGNLLFGSGTVDKDLDSVLAALQSRGIQVDHTFNVDMPDPPSEDTGGGDTSDTGGSRQEPSSPSDRTPPRTPNPGRTQTPAGNGRLIDTRGLNRQIESQTVGGMPVRRARVERAIQALGVEDVQVAVTRASFDGFTLPLGNGQEIKFADATQLTVTQTAQGLRIRGRAGLDRVRMGTEDQPIEVSDAQADVDILIGDPLGGSPTVSVALTNVQAQSVNASIPAGDGQLQLRPAEGDAAGPMMTGGSLTLASDPSKGGPPTLTLDLGTVRGQLRGTEPDASGNQVERLRADVRGRMVVENGTIKTSELDHVELRTSGLGLALGGGLTGQADFDSIVGRGSVALIANGPAINLQPKEGEEAVRIEGRMSLSDGSWYDVREGTASSVVVDGTGVRLSDVRSERFSAMYVLPQAVAGSGAPIPQTTRAGTQPGKQIAAGSEDQPAFIQIHQAVLESDDMVIGPRGVLAQGTLKNSRASVVNLATGRANNTGADFEQVDLVGDAAISLGHNDRYVTLTPIEGSENRLMAHARARRFELLTDKPELYVNLQAGARMEVEVDRFEIGRNDTFEADFGRGWVQGKMTGSQDGEHSPYFRLFPEDFPVQTLLFEPGADVDIEISNFMMTSGADVELRGKIDIIGDLARDIDPTELPRDPDAPPPPEGTPERRGEIGEGTVTGRVRIGMDAYVRQRAGKDGDVAIRADVQFDQGSVDFEFGGQVYPDQEFRKFQRDREKRLQEAEERVRSEQPGQ